MMNTMRTALLLAAMTALFLAIGWLIAGQTGMIIALVAALAMNLFSFWNADKIVLRMYNAREVDRNSGGDLYQIVEQLSRRAELPMPRVYVIENPQPNAFATGRNPENAAVAATSGLLQSMSYEEVAGVMAHELAHVKNRDTLTMTITATLAGAIGFIANFAFLFGMGRSSDNNNPLGFVGVILTMILAPLAAMMVQMAISRAREYEADRGGAEICGRPNWLADALERLGQLSGRIDNHAAERNPATAHMFIVNPLHVRSIDSLFSTHPDMAERVRRLRAMGTTTSGAAAPPNAAAGPWG